MDYLYIISIITAVIVSAAITYFFTQKKNKSVEDKFDDNSVIEDLQKKVEVLNNQKIELESLLEETRSKSEDLSNSFSTFSSIF